MANPDLRGVGTLWEMLQRLAGVSGSSMEQVSMHAQRIIDDPAYRRQVWLAMTGELMVAEVGRDEWVERELVAMKKLADLPSLKIAVDTDRVVGAWRQGCTVHDRYVPPALTIGGLFDACEEVGIKMYSKAIPSGGEDLPTEEGVFGCNFSRIMVPTNDKQHPFNLDYKGHFEWVKALGGSDLSSIEEALYLPMLRGRLEVGHVPFMGGWIRCRNNCGSGRSLGVHWLIDDGLGVDSDDRTDTSWSGVLSPGSSGQSENRFRFWFRRS